MVNLKIFLTYGTTLFGILVKKISIVQPATNFYVPLCGFDHLSENLFDIKASLGGLEQTGLILKKFFVTENCSVE